MILPRGRCLELLRKHKIYTTYQMTMVMQTCCPLIYNLSLHPLQLKVNSLQGLLKFRPIFLVWFLYKVVENVFSNRLMVVISKVILENKFSSNEGCQIFDRILVGNEVVDEANMLKKRLIIFKMDFENAYDFVEWEFRMRCWIRWIF